MRILEHEVMMTEEEVIAYDLLVRKYLKILHAGFIETVINLSPPEGKFLDVGTGTGWIAVGVAKHTTGVRITGIDLSETMLKVARKNAEMEGVADKVEFRSGDAKDLPFEDCSFDAVFCHNMLHHIPDPERMVAEMKRVAKDGGAIIIRDLVRHSPFVTGLHVNIFGMTYTPLMKKEYRDSIMAALSPQEWKDLFVRTFDDGRSRITRQFVTHQSMERPAMQLRSGYLEIPTEKHIKLLKMFYLSKP